MLTYINNGIDAIETAKKTFVQTFVPNKELQKPLNSFVEAQARFARQVAASVNDFATTVGMSMYSVDIQKAFGTSK
jgi:hypothetical protein